MAFEVITELKCVNKKDFNLTIGEIYESACINSLKDSNNFMVFDDDGILTTIDNDCFEITKTTTRNETGWIIKCNDCCLETTICDIFENDNKCPRCGQKFNMS